MPRKSVKQEVSPKRKRRPAALARVEQATVQFLAKGGRGVLVAGGYILTAAHCIDWSRIEGTVIGRHSLESVQTLKGEKLFLTVEAVEPVTDIAVLTAPDNNWYADEAEAFDVFCELTEPVPLYCDEMKPFDDLPVLVFNCDGEWIRAAAQIARPNQPRLILGARKYIQSGASGGPVVTQAGELIGIVSCSEERASSAKADAPYDGGAARPLHALPVWVVNKIRPRTASG